MQERLTPIQVQEDYTLKLQGKQPQGCTGVMGYAQGLGEVEKNGYGSVYRYERFYIDLDFIQHLQQSRLFVPISRYRWSVTASFVLYLTTMVYTGQAGHAVLWCLFDPIHQLLPMNLMFPHLVQAFQYAFQTSRPDIDPVRFDLALAEELIC